MSQFNLTGKIAVFYKQTLDLHLDLEPLQRTRVTLGKIIARLITAEFTFDLAEVGFRKDLIDNAIGAMDGQGEIVIKTHRTETCVVVEITDTGSGIAPDIQAKIFDPFFTTKPPGEGTGLGLNISYNIIVQKHKGKITVDSKQGETRFEVKLPINYEDPQLDT